MRFLIFGRSLQVTGLWWPGLPSSPPGSALDSPAALRVVHSLIGRTIL